MGIVIDFKTREVLSDDGERLPIDEQNRKRNNEYVLNQWLRGMSLAAVPSAATHFPPRAKLAKDQKAITRIYGEGEQTE